MAEFIGRAASVGVAKEASRGTPLVPTHWLPFTSADFTDIVEQVVDGSAVGVIEDSIDAEVTEQVAAGTLEGHLRSESMGLLLLNAMGDVSSALAGGESAVYDHDFSVLNSAEHPSLTISIDEPNSSKSYALGMIGSLGLDIQVNEYAQFSADMRAKAGAAASLTPGIATEKLWLPQHATLKFASDASGLGAAPETKVRSLTLNINKNIEDDQVLGSIDPNDIHNKQFSVEGTVEIMYRDTTFIDDLLGSTKRAVRLLLTNPDTIGTAENAKLRIDLNRVKFSEVTRPLPVDDLVVQTVSFKAHYDLGDAAMITMRLTNETASY